MDGFEGSRKPSRNNGPETNRNHAETSMKPSETKVAGHRRNRETAPLEGRSLVSLPAPPVALPLGRAHKWSGYHPQDHQPGARSPSQNSAFG
jgi:hypothetical protein